MKEKPYPPLWILLALLVPILALYSKISPEGFHFDLVDARTVGDKALQRDRRQIGSKEGVRKGK